MSKLGRTLQQNAGQLTLEAHSRPASILLAMPLKLLVDLLEPLPITKRSQRFSTILYAVGHPHNMSRVERRSMVTKNIY